MREIPKKNYVLLVLLTVFTLFIILYAANWYKASKEYTKTESVMVKLFGEVKEAEIDNYILENPDVVIYVSAENDENISKFEKKFKNYIVKENIKSHFIYLNCGEVSADFISDFQKKYFNGGLKSVKLSYPNLLIVNDGKVIDVLYKLEQEPNISDVKKFLSKYEVTFND